MARAKNTGLTLAVIAKVVDINGQKIDPHVIIGGYHPKLDDDSTLNTLASASRFSTEEELARLEHAAIIYAHNPRMMYYFPPNIVQFHLNSARQKVYGNNCPYAHAIKTVSLE